MAAAPERFGGFDRGGEQRIRFAQSSDVSVVGAVRIERTDSRSVQIRAAPAVSRDSSALADSPGASRGSGFRLVDQPAVSSGGVVVDRRQLSRADRGARAAAAGG